MNTSQAIPSINLLRSNNSAESMRMIHKKPYLSDKSLLRYPGGKTRGIEAITQYFPSNIKEMCSPFFGGGSIELFLASKGIKVYGYDIFKPLTEFWQCVVENPNELAEAVEQFFPLPKKLFYELQEKQRAFKTKLERAAVYYVLNRSSFSGATLSGGMSPQHPRFTRSSIERLRKFYNPNICVNQLDFRKSILLHKRIFLYLDPPYLIESSLYGKKGNAHKDFNHQALCGILKKRDNWIMSYNDCEELRDLYAGFKILKPIWKYGMSNNKSSREILIFSNDLA
jgi:DNA adenine methylase